MHCIDDKPNGIIINHSADWSGDVRIAWYVPAERRDPGPTPPSLKECWCDGKDLVAGLFTPFNRSAEAEIHIATELPVNVITRVVALAVESYLRSKLELLLDTGLFIRRGKL